MGLHCLVCRYITYFITCLYFIHNMYTSNHGVANAPRMHHSRTRVLTLALPFTPRHRYYLLWYFPVLSIPSLAARSNASASASLQPTPAPRTTSHCVISHCPYAHCNALQSSGVLVEMQHAIATHPPCLRPYAATMLHSRPSNATLCVMLVRDPPAYGVSPLSPLTALHQVRSCV